MPPVVYQLMPLDPAASARMLSVLCFGGAAFGAILWLFGSRISQSLVTLIAVAVGATIGLNLPRWFDLPVGSWATAVGGALALGIAGYTLHTLWAGMALACVLGIWAFVATWVGYGLPSDWILRPRPEGMGSLQYTLALWESLPLEMRRVGPMMAGLGVVAGLVLGTIWSRMAVMLLHSLIGVTLMSVLGVVGAELGRPTLLRLIPGTVMGKISLILFLVVSGVLVQWRLATVKGKGESDEDDGG